MLETCIRLLLVRHGQSAANAQNIFTGWSDPPLTSAGQGEARGIGLKLSDARLYPDRIFCSPLQRCTETVRIIVETMDITDCSIEQDSDLNERDYGLLTGHGKDVVGQQYGAERVRHWRRSYRGTPPGGESLRDTAARVLRYYIRSILPAAMTGGTTLIVSSGNALRSLAMTLDGLDEVQIESVELSTGAILLYDLGSNTAIAGRAILQNGNEPA
jgi:2,3-bisphosphoglycerate-dependent phosphoglycerate mutase